MNPHTNLSIVAYAPPEEQYESVEGRDAKTTALKRQYEAEVEHKVASDYQHIVLAYGVIWSLFVLYGVWLWLRSVKIQKDAEALKARLEKR